MTLPNNHPHARTKIVATLGPASCEKETVARLIETGADVFRLNMAHGNFESHERKIQAIREAAGERFAVAILIDLSGPKLRLGNLAEDPTELKANQKVRFVRGESSEAPTDLTSTYPQLVDVLNVGDDILLADGTIQLKVTDKSADATTCSVIEPGTLRSRQGINLPGSLSGLPALTEHDKDCVRWAAKQPIDYLSLSFVQTAQDIADLRAVMSEVQLDVPVIAKIEKREALGALESIVSAADGIMVARGDLGVEIDVALVPVTQKRIVKLCNELQKPVIVATEMLDSMQKSLRPTRAEATDVANAVLDGADACMLSGETAVGDFPVESVETMNRIMMATEEELRNRRSRKPSKKNTTGALPITRAVVFGAGRIAKQLGAKLVVIMTRSGATALAKSNFRDFVPTVAVSADKCTLRRIALYWGILPIMDAPATDLDELRKYIFDWGRREGMLDTGDHVVFVAGSDMGQMSHNSVAVHTVE